MKTSLITILLLVISNVFMTIAWYGHLKLQNSGISKNWPLIAVIASSWGVAFLEYCFMVPANRMGFQGNGGPFTLFQLKILQEVITLTVFTVLAMYFFSGEKLHWNNVAAFLCLIGAVCFTFLPKN
ncbi:MAG: DMT family protein [Lachnospiraceae bacterium]